LVFCLTVNAAKTCGKFDKMEKKGRNMEMGKMHKMRFKKGILALLLHLALRLYFSHNFHIFELFPPFDSGFTVNMHQKLV
jgi:hypothetical protein